MALLDLIQTTEMGPDEIVRRVPETGSGEFKLGSQLIVREGQNAVFEREGKALDTFTPGRYTLETKNIPLLTGLIGLPFGGKSPFTAEVFFVNMTEFTGLKWGTPQPMAYRDKDFGMVRLRAFGTYSMRVVDPQLFIGSIVGARGGYSLAAVEDFLRGIVINDFTALLGQVQTPLLDLPAMTKQMADTMRTTLSDDFNRIGLELVTFQLGGITPPDSVQEKIDERSGMGALGDMGTYTQYQAAQAMRDAAQNPSGGVAGTGVGLGAGVALGQAMAGALGGAMQGAQQPGQAGAAAGAAGAAAVASTPCPKCGTLVPQGSNFCNNCGTAMQPTCASCGTKNNPGAKFCSNCGKALTP